MKKCPDCKISMIIIQDDTPHPYSWGGFRLYGCQNCHQVYYQHLDCEGAETEQLTEDELERMKWKEPEEEGPEKKPKKTVINKKDLKRILKNFDRNFPREVRKSKWIKKPHYDPAHHHDDHLIN